MPILVKSDGIRRGRKAQACHSRLWPTWESMGKIIPLHRARNATCGVANATEFGPLVTNFSRVVASLATAISSYYFIFIYFFIS